MEMLSVFLCMTWIFILYLDEHLAASVYHDSTMFQIRYMLIDLPDEDLLACNTDMVQEDFYGSVCPLLSVLFIAMGCEEKL